MRDAININTKAWLGLNILILLKNIFWDLYMVHLVWYKDLWDQEDLILTPAGNMIPGEHFPLCRTLSVLIIQDQSDYSLRLFLISQ